MLHHYRLGTFALPKNENSPQQFFVQAATYIVLVLAFKSIDSVEKFLVFFLN